MNTSKNPTAPFWTRIVDGIKGRSTKASIATSGSHSSNGSHIIPPENLVYGSCTLRSPTAIVHLDYDPKKLEPKPSSGWTRFVCISDTHTRTFEVPDGDVLLHSGDLTRTGKFAEFETTVEWLCGLPHKVKIIIAGNHDLPLHEGWYDVNFMQWNQVKQSVTKIKALLKGRKARSSGLVYLQDEKYEFQTKKGGKTWSIYGSPAVKTSAPAWKNFNLASMSSGIFMKLAGLTCMTGPRTRTGSTNVLSSRWMKRMRLRMMIPAMARLERRRLSRETTQMRNPFEGQCLQMRLSSLYKGRAERRQT